MPTNEQIFNNAQIEYAKMREKYLEENTSINNAYIDDFTEAKIYAKALELQILKAPASAIFPDLEQMTVSVHPNGVYIVVNGYVDSQNSYGALIRTPFSYNVFKQDGVWKCANFFTSNISTGKGGSGLLKLIGGVLIAISFALDIISIIMIGSDLETFKGLLISGSITFIVGLGIEILGWKI